MDRTKETEEMRGWLISMKNNWDFIVAKTGLTKKALSDIVNKEGHRCQGSTIKLLKMARRSWDASKK